MDEAFALYERWGVAGVKIDFMERDDQEMVGFYKRTVKTAAEHHLAVDFHGAYKPTGMRRTYPNLMTREGVMGNEYNKWGAEVTPEHKVTLPFTRMLAGGMDFTPGGFRQRHKPPSSRRTRAVRDGDARQRACELVVYESDLQVLCDSPSDYLGRRSAPSAKGVPATWDEHGSSAASPASTSPSRGDPAPLVRRQDGRRDGTHARSPARIPSGGTVHAHAFADRPDTADYPDRVDTVVRTLDAGAVLTITMAPGGRTAAWIEAGP